MLAREVRAAVLDDGVLQELLVERMANKGLLGNIYKGRVSRVLPGMQAAFVDIGLDQAAFIYVSDVIDTQFQDIERELMENAELTDPEGMPEEKADPPNGTSDRPIEELLTDTDRCGCVVRLIGVDHQEFAVLQAGRNLGDRFGRRFVQ